MPSTNEDTKIEAEAQKLRIGRSPAYPAMALGKALELAKKIWDAQRKQESHIESTVKVLGYSSLSGSSRRAVAGLKQYNLTSETGEGDNRKIRVSEMAQDILLLPDSDPRRATALQASALAPTIYAALWERYGALLPDDNLIQPFLVRDKGFNDEAARDIVSNYRETFELAKLDKMGDNKPDASKEKADPSKSLPGVPTAGSQPSGSTYIPPVNADSMTQEMPFLVGPGKVARVPFPMAEEDYDLFIGMLNLAKKKLTTLPQPKGRPAIWKNNNTDQPVVVIGEMKAADGAVYFKVEGSEAGIPASQVQFH